MLTVSARQWQCLEDWAERAFVARARAHAQTHFTKRWATLGPQAAEALLQQALGDAQRHGLSLQPQVLTYLSLVFEFGPGFPQRPSDAWARTILGDGLPDTVERLFRAGLAQIEAAESPGQG